MGCSSRVIDELSDWSRKAGGQEIGLAYVYCDYRDQSQQTTVNLMGGLLKQLLVTLPELPEELITIHRQKYEQERTSLELSDAVEMFHSTCRTFNRTYICLDALDECQDVIQLLKCLQDTPSSVRLFTTSRKHIQTIVQHHFKESVTISIVANESDIKAFIKGRIEENRIQEPDIMDEKLEKEITERIVAFSKGMSVAL
jgi:hypothetical protein